VFSKMTNVTNIFNISSVLIDGYKRDILAILWRDRWPSLNCHKAGEGIKVLELDYKDWKEKLQDLFMKLW
jgi:hypothetical protein